MHTRYLQAKFSSRPKCADQLWGPRSLLLSAPGFFPGGGGGKRPRREVNHLLPSSATIKNEWSYTFTPLTRLHGVDEENVTFFYLTKWMSRDSSVGITTRYGLDRPGIEYQWGEIFRTLPCGLPSPLYNGYRIFPGVNLPGCCVDHPNLSSAKNKARVELYIYSPPGPSWPVLGANLPLRFT
jgi:hypothetical protein